jgi:hypothetical protein
MTLRDIIPWMTNPRWTSPLYHTSVTGTNLSVRVVYRHLQVHEAGIYVTATPRNSNTIGAEDLRTFFFPFRTNTSAVLDGDTWQEDIFHIKDPKITESEEQQEFTVSQIGVYISRGSWQCVDVLAIGSISIAPHILHDAKLNPFNTINGRLEQVDDGAWNVFWTTKMGDHVVDVGSVGVGERYTVAYWHVYVKNEPTVKWVGVAMVPQFYLERTLATSALSAVIVKPVDILGREFDGLEIQTNTK